MKFLSLFSGIGGMDLGLEYAGHECMAMAEKDPWCRGVLAKHWPGIPIYEDVEELLGPTVPTFEFDAIVGGDPCQAHSVASTAHGTSAKSLGGMFIEVIRKYRPKIVLRENPPARKNALWTPEKFVKALQDLGYAAVAIRLRACCAGAPIRRERMFVLAALQEPECTRLERYVSTVMERAEEGRPDPYLTRSDRWSATPRILRKGIRFPHRMDRIRALGNCVVPATAEYFGRVIRYLEQGKKRKRRSRR